MTGGVIFGAAKTRRALDQLRLEHGLLLQWNVAF